MLKYIKSILQDLKLARQAKGMSQRALALKVGIPQSHLSRIESGRVNIQLTSLIEISRVLELELMLVPRQKINLVRGLIKNDSPKPAYTLDEDLEGEE